MQVHEANQAVKQRDLFVRYLLEHYDEIFEKDAGAPMTPGIFKIEEGEKHVPHSPCTPSPHDDGNHFNYDLNKEKKKETIRAVAVTANKTTTTASSSVSVPVTRTITVSDVSDSVSEAREKKKKEDEKNVAASNVSSATSITVSTSEVRESSSKEEEKTREEENVTTTTTTTSTTVEPTLRVLTAPRVSSDAKLLSRKFDDDDAIKTDSTRSIHGIEETLSGVTDGGDSSGSESCLSDEDVTEPHRNLPVVKEGYLVKHAISSRSFFSSARKRYFRLVLDERQRIAFLSYYKDDVTEEAKGHLILADGCHVSMKTSKAKNKLCVTFHDDIKDARERQDRDVQDKKHTLVLNVSDSKDPHDSLKSWADALEKTISSISSNRENLSIAESDSCSTMTHKALERDATGVMVQAGYDAPVRKRSTVSSSHQHGISIGKTLVSKKKRRLVTEDGFDLDLAYITSNIVAMGFPSTNFEGWFVRNNIKDVVDFFDSRHENLYMIYNLCIEKGRQYDAKHFQGRVQCFPHFDHNPPPIKYFWPFCRSVAFWLEKDPKSVVAVHCKAGKGRTGVMICAYLLYRFGFSAAASMKFYAKMRTHDGKGVTLPSQKRFIRHFAELCEPPFGWSNAMFAMLGDCEGVRPVGSVPLRTDTAQRFLKSVHFHNVPEWMLDSGDHLSLEITSGFWTKEPRVSVAKQSRMFNMNMEKRTVEIDFTCKGTLDGVELCEEVKFVLYVVVYQKKYD